MAKPLRNVLWLITLAGMFVANPSYATITIYTSLVDFTAATQNVGTDTLDDLAYSNVPVTRTAGSFDYTVSSTHSIIPAGSAEDVWLSVDAVNDPINIGTFSAGVNAVGGNFFESDALGHYVSGDITVTATDASGSVSQTIIAATTSSFLGFVSTETMTSLTVNSATALIWPTVNNLVLGGAPPTPIQDFTYDSPNGFINARPNTTVDLSGSIGNTGAGNLTVRLSSTGTLNVTDLTPTGGLVGGGAALGVSGTIHTGTTAGEQYWQVSNTDSSATITTANILGGVNVYDYANAKYSGGVFNFGHVHQGATVTAQNVLIGNQTVTDASYQDLLDVSATTDNAKVTATGFTGLAASTDGATTGTLSIAVDTSTLGSLASTVTLTLTSNANGVEGLSNGTATTVGAPSGITTLGSVYSGQGVWNTDGGGNWSDFSKWTTDGGSPGLDAGFTTTDTATFGDAASSANSTVTLNGVIASLKALTFDNSAKSYTVDSTGVGALVLDGGGSGATVTVSAGSHAINAPVTLSDNTEVAVTHEEDLLSMTREITGSGNLTKSGAGMLFLSGTDTYTGTTNVNAGTLALTGSLTGGGDTTVAAGAYLVGSGSIAPAEDHSLYVNGSLVVHNFFSSSDATTFSVTGGLVMGAGSVIAVDLFTGAGLGDSSGTASAADQLSLNGTLNATAGGTLVIGNSNHMTNFASGDQWKLIDLAGGSSITGTLTVNDSALGLAAGFTGSFDQTTGIYSIVDYRGAISAQSTGLPMANAESQAIIAGVQTALNDVNNHLFNLRAGMGEEEESDGSIASAMDDGVIVGQGDGPEDKNPMAKHIKRSRQWEVFTTVNYGNVKLSPINNQAGVQVDSWASSVGVERHLSRSFMLGFAATFLQSTQNYTSGLGHLDLEGPMVSAYLTYVRKDYWSSLLYSFGDYDLGSTRNPGIGLPVASGATRAYTHAVQYNTGYNFRFQNNTLITGPFVGIDYLHGSIDAYTETGGGVGALAYGRQSFESLVTRVGWSTSKKIETDWAVITPQLRLSYERQNIKNNGTSVQTLNVPFTATGGNQTPGQDYMVIGTSVNFQFTPEFSMLLGYQVQLFRNDMESHFGTVRFGYKF